MRRIVVAKQSADRKERMNYMDWPGIEEIADCLANPERALAGSGLQHCRMQGADGEGRPVPIRGSHTAVFRARLDREADMALRVFLQPSGARDERYRRLSESLERGRPAGIVNFEYFGAGLLCGGKTYPLLAMDWVEGVPLRDWIRLQCHEGNQALLRDAAEQWADLIRDFARCGLVHGNLNADSIYVRNSGRLVLLDYDAMQVLPEGAAAEGTVAAVDSSRNFGPPGSSGARLPARHADTFPALQILASLLLFAEHPDFWKTYLAPDTARTLLLTDADLAEPMFSPVVQDVLEHGGERGVRLTKQLLALCEIEPTQLPRLDMLVEWLAISSDDERSFAALWSDPELLNKHRRDRLRGSRMARVAAVRPPSAATLDLKGSQLRPSLERRRDGVFNVRWTWPDARICKRCLLAVGRRILDPSEDPHESSDVYWLRTVEEQDLPKEIAVERGWNDAVVLVWALLELDGFSGPPWRSAPCVLGTLADDAGTGSFWQRTLKLLGRNQKRSA